MNLMEIAVHWEPAELNHFNWYSICFQNFEHVYTEKCTFQDNYNPVYIA